MGHLQSTPPRGPCDPLWVRLSDDRSSPQRGIFAWLLPSAIALIAASTGCGSSAALSDGAEATSATTSTASSTTGEAESDAHCAPIRTPVVEGPGAQMLELVALRTEIPGLADQPTANGQRLGTLYAFDGRLHLGYGDYGENTGPIAMSAWDPRDNIFVHLGVVPSEEVLWFRPHDDWLYSPAVDPDAHQGIGGVYRLRCGAPEWVEGTPITGAVHVYDVAVQGETIYAATGSLTGEPALLMASDDHGESWSEVHRRDSAPDEFSRFYFVGATPDRLFVSGSHAHASIREGGGDFKLLHNPPEGFLVPIILRDAMVIAAFAGNPGRGIYLSSYRVEGSNFVPDSPWPTEPGADLLLTSWAPGSTPDHLVVLMSSSDGDASVLQTTSLVGTPSWEHLAHIPAGTLPENDRFVSMALLMNDLYLGTRQGALYALRELERPALGR